MSSPSPFARLLLAASLISAWMVALLVGWTLGGWVHLVLLAALAIFPWRPADS